MTPFVSFVFAIPVSTIIAPYLDLVPCKGVATTTVMIKDGAKPKLPPSFPPMLSIITAFEAPTITAFEAPTAWNIMVNGTGEMPCKCHVPLLSLPEMSIFKYGAMTYQKSIFGVPGEGMLTIQKPQPSKDVLVEAMTDTDDKVDNKGCVGAPTLDLHVAAAPAPLKKSGLADTEAIKQKKGWITALTINKQLFSSSESLPATVTVQGDRCHFIWKKRRLPVTGPDIALDNAETDPLRINQWDLSNLGQGQTVGDYEVFMQAAPYALPAGEVSCDIAPGPGTRVFFTVVP